MKNKHKGFLYQIRTETKKLLRSKFFVICMILLLVLSAGIPILGKLNIFGNRYERYEMMRPDMEELVIKGQTIKADNPEYWDLRDMNQYLEHLDKNASTAIDDLRIKYLNTLIDSKLETAAHVLTHEDFRRELSWQKDQIISELFILDHLYMPFKELAEAMDYRMYKDPAMLEKEYKDLTPVEIGEKRDEANDKLTRINKIIVDNDHIEFYNYKIEDQNKNLEENQKRIESLEKDIIENPSQEEMYSEQIKGIQKSNKIILEVDIPSYQYSIDHNIIPGTDDWREVALNHKRDNQRSILYVEVLPEDKFEETQHLKDQYKTYYAYEKAIQKEIDGYNKKLYVAEKSLETGKPDMKYIENGSRKATFKFLWYSMAIAVLGAIIAGGLIAREFQSGTIRLLLIRPKTRTKIVLSKFLALIIICFVLYALTALVNLLTNGILLGFSDLAHPNYTISSPNGIPFMAYYLPKFLLCFTTVLFASAVGFFLSVLTKITALSVATPLICFVGSMIGMQFVQYRPQFQWVAYTPLPYINIASLFSQETSRYALQPIPAFGIPLMIGLSVILVVAATWIFNKRDVTN